MPDQRQREVRVEELAERGEQGEEQQPEADEDEPVRRRRPTVHWSIRVCPRVSLSMRDRAGARVVGAADAGWPTLITRDDLRIARTNRAMPTAAMARETTMAKICMEGVLLVRLSRRPVTRTLPEPIAAYVAASVPGPVA